MPYPRKYAVHRKVLLLFTSLFLILVLSSMSVWKVQASSAEPKTFTVEQLSEWLKAVNITAIREHVEYLTSLGTRATGYEGNIKAAQYIYEKFREYGLVNVTYQNFTVVDAISYGANITIGNEVINLHPLLPNLVCLSTTGPEGIKGRLVYAGQGYLEDFDGLPVNGSIVLMDWDTLDRWLNAARLGAKAVIFLHSTDPGHSLYGEHNAPQKRLPTTPLDFPRFYADKEATSKLLACLDIQKRISSREATLLSTQKFTRVKTQNILGWVVGKNPTDNGWTAEESKFGWTNPYEYPVCYFAISSYYDSGSIAPSAAPGAQEALGIATLIELARYLNQHKPDHSILFVAFGAHHQAQGGMNFALKYLWNFGWAWEENLAQQPSLTPKGARKPLGLKIRFAINLDFSTGTDRVFFTHDSPVHGGMPECGPRGKSLITLKNYFTDLTNHLESISGKDYKIYFHHEWTEPPQREVVTAEANPWKLWPYDTYAWFLSEIPSFCITTAQDSRPYYFTPYDTIEKINWQNLKTQLEVAFPSIISLINQDDDWLQNLYESFWEPSTAGGAGIKPFNYMTYAGVAPEAIKAFGKFTGRVGYWSRDENWYRPVKNALVVITGIPPEERITFPFFQIYNFSDEYGRFEFNIGFFSNMQHGLDAFVINETTGDIIMAPDLGQYAYQPYPYFTSSQTFAGYMGGATLWTTYNDTVDMGWFTVFNCSTWTVFDVSSLTGLLDARYYITPISYGSWTYGILPQPYGVAQITASLGSPGLSVSVLAVKPGDPVVYVPLLNASKENPLGAGYIVGTKPGGKFITPFTVLAYAENLYWITEDRFTSLLQFNPTIAESMYYKWHLEAGAFIQKAKEALANNQYSKANLYAFMAKNLEERAYGYTKQTTVDSVSSVIYLSAFLVPFTYLAEKLFFGFNGVRRLISFLGIFASITIILYILHPGFLLAASPIMIIIGVSVFLLTIPLLVIVIHHIFSLLKKIRKERLGIHEAEVSRIEQLGNSFIIGVENMRRLKLRSSLTLIAIIIVVAAIVSLVSMEPIQMPIKSKLPAVSLYDEQARIYIHKVMWGEGSFTIDDQTFQLIKARYEPNATIIPRAWKYYSWPTTKNLGKRAGFRLTYGEKDLAVPSILGLTAQDPVWETALIYGRFFLPGERRAIILTEDEADFLGINKTQLERGISPTVYFETLPYRVVGIVDGKALYSLKEIDGQEVTPIIMDDPLIQAGHWSFHENPILYVHDNSSAGCYFMILPFDEVKEMNGGIASISLIPKDPSKVEEMAREINFMFPVLNVYFLTMEGQIFLYKIGVTASVWGYQYTVMPMIISALFLFNMTLGNIYERRRSIAIYATVGLSPFHTAIMFLAENVNYAVIGGVMGYIFAVIINRCFSFLLPGVAMNYTSTFVLLGIGSAISVIVLASIYPMMVAAKLVTPSLERAWRPPTKPKGDVWEIPLPFLAADKNEAQSVFNYIIEYLSSHSGRESPDFHLTTKIKTVKGRREEKPYMAAECDVVMHPVEVGVSQRVTFIATEAMPPKWEFQVILRRKMGEIKNWTRMGRTFVDLIRKQLLLWRGLKLQERERYL